MDCRNPTYNRFGTIDAEINHQTYGWIPCTLNPSDPPTAAMFAACEAGDFGPVTPYVMPLELAQAEKLAELQRAYDTTLTADVTYMGFQFQADDASQLLLLKATANNGRKWAGFWQGTDNVMHPMTYEEGLGLFDAMADLVPGAFINLQTKKAAVRAATTVQQVEAVTWNA